MMEPIITHYWPPQLADEHGDKGAPNMAIRDQVQDVPDPSNDADFGFGAAAVATLASHWVSDAAASHWLSHWLSH